MEQLQQTLNKAIEIWFTYKFIWIENLVYCNDAIVCSKEPYDDITYHELFSKDSWLMEFMKWKEVNLVVWSSSAMWDDNQWQKLYRNHHYKTMSTMTAKDKIDYFNTNSYLSN